ncbi:MAG: biopolymer transporter Tol [Gemmataceae bacterium]|nr:biopolymer transporter Tol [Gemmataceae bacterium]MCI0740546.1 biopolymer transporter Tol [Gemmataceae bacterium]
MWKVAALLVLGGGQDGDWKAQEAAYLKNTRQVTFDFARAGEGYFSPDAKHIIFQAEEAKSENPFYQQFVMEVATGKLRRVSPGIGKTTCGYFLPGAGNKIIFSSSHLDPDAKKHYAVEWKQRDQEKQTKKRRRYVWDFDPHMDIFEANPDGTALRRLTDAPGYDAEGSYSADGKHIVFCSDRSGKDNLELYVMDADGKNVRQLTRAPGCYNGGPFFSPDGKKVIFRSDRKKKDHLQLFVINADGSGEKALTDDENWVFWAPFWYKDSRHILYTAADHSNPMARPNYDLYWMDFATGTKTRLTFAPGADVLPVFSPDYRQVMWTSTRDGRSPSQLYVADFTAPRR